MVCRLTAVERLSPADHRHQNNDFRATESFVGRPSLIALEAFEYAQPPTPRGNIIP
jgi:hypothetical protein